MGADVQPLSLAVDKTTLTNDRPKTKLIVRLLNNPPAKPVCKIFPIAGEAFAGASLGRTLLGLSVNRSNQP